MTPIILNPTEQSPIALLLLKHVQGAYPCPQKKSYRKRWVQYQAGVAEVATVTALLCSRAVAWLARPKAGRT